jgi:hypothetical protein
MVAAERLANNKSLVVNLGIESKLTLDITYTRWNGVEVVLCQGTDVFVDVLNGLACFKDDYFPISYGEYTVNQPN